MVFIGRDCQEGINCESIINNIPLDNANTAVDPGHTLSKEQKSSLVSAAIAQFWNSLNLFKADFGHIHPYVQCKQYCCSFYGAPLWLLSSQGVSDVCIAWMKALRKTWKRFPMTHCDVVALIAESKPLEVSLRQRFCKFSAGIDKYGLDVLKTIVNVARSNLFLFTVIIMWK